MAYAVTHVVDHEQYFRYDWNYTAACTTRRVDDDYNTCVECHRGGQRERGRGTDTVAASPVRRRRKGGYEDGAG
jgi:hypothetical protein